MVLCGTWSETSVAQSQLTQFWHIPRHRMLSYSLWTPFIFHDYPLAVEPGSTPRLLVQKKLGEILYLLICSILPCLSWLLRSRVRKSRRDFGITLQITQGNETLFPNWQKESWQTFEKTSGYVRPERVKKWPNSMTDIRWWWRWWWQWDVIAKHMWCLRS